MHGRRVFDVQSFHCSGQAEFHTRCQATGLSILDFGFVSDFDIRISNFQPGGADDLGKDISPKKNGYPNQPVVAVGAIVFRDNRVLLVRRGQPPSQDLWAIPGGRVEIGETLQEAAEREILEETGITIKALDPVYTFDYIERDGSARTRYHYVIVDLMANYVGGEPRAGDDAAEARWVSSEEMGDLTVSSTTVGLLKTHYNFGI